MYYPVYNPIQYLIQDCIDYLINSFFDFELQEFELPEFEIDDNKYEQKETISYYKKNYYDDDEFVKVIII